MKQYKGEVVSSSIVASRVGIGTGGHFCTSYNYYLLARIEGPSKEKKHTGDDGELVSSWQAGLTLPPGSDLSTLLFILHHL